MSDAINRLVEHVVSTRYEDLPHEAIEAAKMLTLDTVGVGIAGSSGPHVDKILAVHAQPGAARLLGQPGRFAPEAAALVNGYQIHISEFDCVHEAAVVHTMTVLLAALLADADESGGVDGRDLIRAAALGVDTACNLGVAATTGLRFFRPATAGAFAAVAAVGAARRYDADTLKRAFALVYSQLCGTMQAHTEGSPLLALQVGFNARNALVACRLAEQGVPGLEGILEGPFGYYNLIEAAGDIASTVAHLGQQWRICEVALKPFPCGRATHGIVDAIQELQRDETIDAGAVKRVEARVPSLTNHLIGRPVNGSMSINYARLNGQYAAAVMLRRGFIGIQDYGEQAIGDPSTLELAGRVQLVVDDNPDPNALSPVTVDVHLDDGCVLTRTVSDVYGTPAKPMDREARLAKFSRCFEAAATPLPSHQCQGLIDCIDALPELDDVREIVSLATP